VVSEDDFTPLFTSDLARDVRAELVERFTAGISVADATAHALAHFRDVLADPNDGPVVILAIASFQLDHAQLQRLIRDASIDLIESGEADSAWKTTDNELRGQRRELLQQLLIILREAEISEA
jgi:hypothetical protein